MAAFKPAGAQPIFRPQQLRPLLASAPQTAFFKPSIASAVPIPVRRASSKAAAAPPPPPPPEIPEPTPFCPDPKTFLTLIGRGLSAHASKFPNWEALFTLSSEQLRELGVEPPRTRRYLIQWRQKFRRGEFGVGGDLKHVQDGVADLRVLEHDADPVHPQRFVVNVPPGGSVKTTPVEELSRVSGYKVLGAKTIAGPYALPLKDGEGARITIQEGMWEMKRGRKIDGGERRRTEVRYKKRIQARREMRERGEIP